MKGGDRAMSNWLQNATKTCCDELYEIAMFLQAKEEAFIKANDNYYGVVLATLDATDIHQEQSAIAFVAAVNSDINRSKYKIDGLWHVCSAAKILRTAITDRKSTRLNSSHVAISYAVFCLKKKISRRRQ